MSVLQIVLNKVIYIGYADQLSDYEKKILVIFNILNFTGFGPAIISMY